MENTTKTGAEMNQKKVTLYFRGGFGFAKIEARAYAVEVGAYAQYASAVTCTFIGKGQRVKRGFVQTFQPSLLILEGWGHPDTADIYGPAQTSADGSVTTLRGRFLSCSPEWSTEFEAMIAQHISAGSASGKPVKVVADYQGHDSMKPAPAAVEVAA